MSVAAPLGRQRWWVLAAVPKKGGGVLRLQNLTPLEPACASVDVTRLDFLMLFGYGCASKGVAGMADSYGCSSRGKGNKENCCVAHLEKLAGSFAPISAPISLIPSYTHTLLRSPLHSSILYVRVELESKHTPAGTTLNNTTSTSIASILLYRKVVSAPDLVSRLPPLQLAFRPSIPP